MYYQVLLRTVEMLIDGVTFAAPRVKYSEGGVIY
jgi:hypothetical protein